MANEVRDMIRLSFRGKLPQRASFNRSSSTSSSLYRIHAPGVKLDERAERDSLGSSSEGMAEANPAGRPYRRTRAAAALAKGTYTEALLPDVGANQNHVRAAGRAALPALPHLGVEPKGPKARAAANTPEDITSGRHSSVNT